MPKRLQHEVFYPTIFLIFASLFFSFFFIYFLLQCLGSILYTEFCRENSTHKASFAPGCPTAYSLFVFSILLLIICIINYISLFGVQIIVSLGKYFSFYLKRNIMQHSLNILSSMLFAFLQLVVLFTVRKNLRLQLSRIFVKKEKTILRILARQQCNLGKFLHMFKYVSAFIYLMNGLQSSPVLYIPQRCPSLLKN